MDTISSIVNAVLFADLEQLSLLANLASILSPKMNYACVIVSASPPLSTV